MHMQLITLGACSSKKSRGLLSFASSIASAFLINHNECTIRLLNIGPVYNSNMRVQFPRIIGAFEGTVLLTCVHSQVGDAFWKLVPLVIGCCRPSHRFISHCHTHLLTNIGSLHWQANPVFMSVGPPDAAHSSCLKPKIALLSAT